MKKTLLSPNLIIKKAEKTDINKIAEIFRKGYIEEPYNEKWTEENSLKKIKDYYNGSKVLVIAENNNIIGFLIYYKMIWDNKIKLYINEIVVLKEFRNQGIGTRLLNEAEKAAEKENINNIELASHIKSKAFQLYKKLGYKESGLVIMEKIIK